MNFIEFCGFYFDFSGIFPNLIHLKKGKKGLFNGVGPARLTWHGADTWQGHASPCRRLRGAYVA